MIMSNPIRGNVIIDISSRWIELFKTHDQFKKFNLALGTYPSMNMEMVKVNIMKLEKNKNEGKDGFNKTRAKLDFAACFDHLG